MIDTVRIRLSRPLRCPHQETKERVKSDDGWRFAYSLFRVGTAQCWGLLVTHLRTDLRIGIVGDTVVMVEVSLPRLIFGENASIITSQGEIDRALAEIESLLANWAGRPAENGGEIWEFARVDLVLPFRIPGFPAAAFINAMATMNHPDCRTYNSKWRHGTTTNAAYHAAGDMTILSYDKQLEVDESRGPGNVARIEIRLEGAPLQRWLGPEVGVFPRALRFEDCYRAYRGILRKFRPVTYQMVEKRSVMQFLRDLLAHAHQQGWTMADGRPVLDHLRSCDAGSQTIRKYERDLAGRQLASMSVSWDELIPEQWPPQHLARSLNQQYGVSATRQRRRTD